VLLLKDLTIQRAPADSREAGHPGMALRDGMWGFLHRVTGGSEFTERAVTLGRAVKNTSRRNTQERQKAAALECQPSSY
jgi:hypothetical protein